MRIELTEENIDRYSLCAITGESKSELLKAARIAFHQSGYTLFVVVPDEAEEETSNVFEHYDSTPAVLGSESRNPVERGMRMVASRRKDVDLRVYVNENPPPTTKE